ncbi:gamma-glutamylcyclotransferase [Aquisalibacillus elongatus]|uniref:Gamma-glutamylcyclotransferase (GGCT)/AIG2-like uncharacterized protein YtfP n=1 Tax=Aquisalibacillus elongatus TaxID=485577 RepID=A0A3N5B4J7_9BACI|nr:gamma-glutamylcyclotransferase [Aquisalibacillus elongatus]RPF52243.1 gamma-glutamylcyclotransferase (GGCT)/AIG2-like uncharacterized protein YtfP [Aquisalibacillus elongatus]
MKLFVYGTLRKGERNHDFLKQATLISEQSWTEGFLIDTGYDYPAMVIDSDNLVYGEVYEIDSETLAKVDALEGYKDDSEHNHYMRSKRMIYSDVGSMEAYVYYYHHSSQHEKVPHNDWRLKKLLEQGTPLYFAYGSCMDHERIEQAGMLKQFETLGVGVLPRHELRFTVSSHDGGRADIVEANTHEVEGIVYRISEKALDYLYEREGVHIGKYRPAVVDVKFDGEKRPMLTFIVKEKMNETSPPDHYLNEILRGGEPHLSASYLEKIEQRVRNLRVGK